MPLELAELSAQLLELPLIALGHFAASDPVLSLDLGLAELPDVFPGRIRHVAPFSGQKTSLSVTAARMTPIRVSTTPTNVIDCRVNLIRLATA